jgi:acyl dehydratase
VGLVELEEGTRLLTNIVDIDPDSVQVGMPVELVIRRENSERPLPLFRPIRPERRTTTRARDSIRTGDELPACPIPITATLIVSTALASRDYQDVHHDRELAKERGSPDIFMNILTTSGLCARYVTDWAGPEAVVKRLSIRLGVPNYPHDTMTMSGSVRAERDGRVELDIRGYNRLGDHVTGRVELELPAESGGGD